MKTTYDIFGCEIMVFDKFRVSFVLVEKFSVK